MCFKYVCNWVILNSYIVSISINILSIFFPHFSNKRYKFQTQKLQVPVVYQVKLSPSHPFELNKKYLKGLSWSSIKEGSTKSTFRPELHSTSIMFADVVPPRPDPFFTELLAAQKEKSCLLRLFISVPKNTALTWASTRALHRLRWRSDAAPSSQTRGTNSLKFLDRILQHTHIPLPQSCTPKQVSPSPSKLWWHLCGNSCWEQEEQH